MAEFDFDWMAHVDSSGPCWEWTGPGYPPAQKVWMDLMGGFGKLDYFPLTKVLQRKCGNHRCVDPSHMRVQNRKAMQAIAHTKRWGGSLPEWEGKGCGHSQACWSMGCPICQ